MRALCLISSCPLPPSSADDRRLLSFLEAWRSLGTVDVVVRGAPTDVERDRLRTHLDAATIEPLPEADERLHGERLGWLRHRTVPLAVASLDPEPARVRMRRIVHQLERPDAVFAGDPFMAWLLRPAVWPAPWFVDVPVVSGPSPWGMPVTSPRAAVRALRDRDRSIVELFAIDRSARFELHQAGAAHVASVRSAADREALGSPTAVVMGDAAIADAYEPLVRRTVDAAGSYAPKGWP